MARPTLYTPEVVERVCEYLCQGITLEEIGRMDDMPSANTLHDWKSPNPSIKPNIVPDSVASDIARARDVGYDVIASRLRLVAAGIEGHTSNDVQRDKLIIETDLKLLAKWTKKYSDSINQRITDGDGQPLKVNDATQAVLALLTTEQLEKALADVTNKAESV